MLLSSDVQGVSESHVCLFTLKDGYEFRITIVNYPLC